MVNTNLWSRDRFAGTDARARWWSCLVYRCYNEDNGIVEFDSVHLR